MYVHSWWQWILLVKLSSCNYYNVQQDDMWNLPEVNNATTKNLTKIKTIMKFRGGVKQNCFNTYVTRYTSLQLAKLDATPQLQKIIIPSPHSCWKVPILLHFHSGSNSEAIYKHELYSIPSAVYVINIRTWCKLCFFNQDKAKFEMKFYIWNWLSYNFDFTAIGIFVQILVALYYICIWL